MIGSTFEINVSMGLRKQTLTNIETLSSESKDGSLPADIFDKVKYKTLVLTNINY